MHIPQFWSKGTADGVHPNGRPVELSRFRSSDMSLGDARARAVAAAREAVQAWISGSFPDAYWYARGPIREEVIERFSDDRGELFAALTRNRYGALVLNSARVMFIDWDAPRRGIAGGLSAIKRLFGSKTPTAEVLHEQRIRERFARFRDEQPEWSLRLYRTARGLAAWRRTRCSTRRPMQRSPRSPRWGVIRSTSACAKAKRASAHGSRPSRGAAAPDGARLRGRAKARRSRGSKLGSAFMNHGSRNTQPADSSTPSAPPQSIPMSPQSSNCTTRSVVQASRFRWREIPTN